MLRLHWVIGLIVLTSVVLPSAVTHAQNPTPTATPSPPSDPEEVYAQAVVLFDRGDWRAAADAFDSILNPPRLRSREKIKRARVYRGICLVILKDEDGAEAEFYQVLLLDPKHQLDPQYTPPEIIEFFNGIRKKYADELGTGNSGDNTRQNPRDGRRVEQDPDVNVGTDFLLTVAPFGIGQIHNEQRTKGFVMMGAELTLLATNVVSYLYLQDVVVDGKVPRSQLGTAQAVRAINLTAFSALIVIVAYGLIDALVYKYGAAGGETEPQTAPQPTPPSPRPVLSITPGDPGDPGVRVTVGLEFAF